jgi:predicted amidohydrolase
MAINVAAVQYGTSNPTAAVNLDKAMHLLDDAAHLSDLVLLPLNSFLNLVDDCDLHEIAEPWGGPLSAIGAQIAVMRNCYICYSMIERDGDRIYNTSVLFAPNGVLLGRQRKTHLTEWERAGGLSTGDALNVFASNIGNIAILAIEETMDVETVRSLQGKKAQILLVPAEVRVDSPDNFGNAIGRWERLVRALAVRGRWCVVAANKIGSARDGTFIGNSLLMDVSGEVLARGVLDKEQVARASAVVPPRGTARAE